MENIRTYLVQTLCYQKNSTFIIDYEFIRGKINILNPRVFYFSNFVDQINLRPINFHSHIIRDLETKSA